MNQQEKTVEKIKECGLCLAGLLLSLSGLLWAVWNDYNFYFLMLVTLIFSYYLYSAVAINAYSIILTTLNQHWKYTRLHDFIQKKNEEPQPSKTIWQLDSKSLEKHPAEIDEKNNFNQAEKKGNEVQLDQPIKQGRLTIVKKKTKIIPEKGNVLEQERKSMMDTDQFLMVREKFKQTLKKLSEKGMNTDIFEHLCSMAKNSYLQKVRQLIEMSEDNERALVAVAEEYFQVKVMFQGAKIPEKLEPILLDDLIERVKLLEFTRSLPWKFKKSEKEQMFKCFSTFDDLVALRIKIDKVLSPHCRLHQKTRSKLCSRLREQMEGRALYGRDLLMVLLKLFNENVEDKKYQLHVKVIGEQREGIEVAQSLKGDRYHVDLVLLREKEEVFHSKPGEDNFWTMLALAAQIKTLKL